MAIAKTYLGRNPDGSPHFWYEAEPGDHVVMTGPIYGSIATADGTEYDVNEPLILARLEHLGEISHAISVRHEAEGHPEHGSPGSTDPDNPPFMHVCTDHCGALKREG